MEVDLAARTVVVTGGTRGVGRAVVVKLCASGANVVFQGRDIGAAEATVDAARQRGTAPVFAPGDLYDYDSVAGLCDTAIDRFGGLHGAVGNGMRSHPPARLFRETDPSDLLGYFEQGALHRAYLAHAAALRMASAGYGKIVLVTTDGGRVPTPSETMIGTAAAAVVYMSRAVARELARDGVRVNTVAITLTRDTPGYDRTLQRRADGTGGTLGRVFEKIEARMPFGLGTAAETADVIAFLLGPESDGITGATLSINRGGYFPAYA
jgi:3-oxoacyl-[acyl-carrier protein] reductase